MKDAVVVKAGGRALLRNMRGILEDVARVARERPVVLVHGGGDVVTEYSRRLGIEPRFVVSPSGVRSRYTSKEELEVFVMVMAGKINKEVVATLNTLGATAIGLSGIDASLLKAVRKKRIIIVDERGRKRVIEGGYTGKITEVNTEVLTLIFSKGLARVVAVAPLALSEEGEMLNVDADQAATALAKALKVKELVLLTDVDAVYVDGTPVREVVVDEVPALIKKVGFGMNRKLIMAAEAIKARVGKVIIAPGTTEAPLTSALQGKAGTIIKGC